MIARSRLLLKTVLVLALGASLTSLLHGQMGMGGNGQFAEKMAENGKKLKQYNYMQKTTIFVKGDLRATKLARVHYDAQTGEKISVPLDSPAAASSPEPAGRRPVLGRIKEKKIAEKKDEMADYIERLTALMSQYLPPNPDRIKAAMPHADMAPSSGGVVKVVLNSYLLTGDTMTLSLDAATKSLNQILINSKLDSDPVTFQVAFDHLPDGTNYPSLTKIDSPAKELRIEVATSDYRK